MAFPFISSPFSSFLPSTLFTSSHNKSKHTGFYLCTANFFFFRQFSSLLQRVPHAWVWLRDMVANGWLEDYRDKFINWAIPSSVGWTCATHPKSFLLLKIWWLQQPKKKNYSNHSSRKDDQTILLNYKTLKDQFGYYLLMKIEN